MDKMLNYLFPECDVAFEMEYVELKSRAAEAFNQGGTTAEASIDSYRLGIRPCLSGIPIYMDMGYRMDGKKFDGMIWGRFWPIWNRNLPILILQMRNPLNCLLAGWRRIM